MSIDSRDKRAAGVGVGSPWRGILPAPDATVGQLSDRQIVTFGYPSIEGLGVYVEPHRYLYWPGYEGLAESDLNYWALVKGAATPSAVDGYAILWIDSSGNLRHINPSGNTKTVTTSEGVITSSSTVANTTTETTVFTETIAANTLHVGRVVKVRLLGRYSTVSAAPTFTARLKIAGSTVESIVSTAANVTNAPLDIEYIFTVRSIGASGTVWSFASATFNNTPKDVADSSATTIDTTAADDMTLTIQWDAADASNTVSIDQGWVELVA